MDMSFDRETVCCRDAGLARIGNNFIDCLHEHVRVDDRGTSFAFWRHSDIVPESQVCVYFCFDFLVEIGDEKILSLAEQDNGLGLYEMKRRGDSVFTPITRSIWINEDLEEPEQDVLSKLCKGYSNRDDKNLNVSRWKTLKDQAVFDADNWPDLCRITYQHSRKLLIQKLDLKQLIENFS